MLPFGFGFDLPPVNNYVPEQYTSQQQIVRRVTDTDARRFYENIDLLDAQFQELKR